MGTSLERPKCLTRIGDWLGEAAVWLVMSAGPRQSPGPGQQGLLRPQSPAVFEALVAPRGIRNPPAPHPWSPGFWHTGYWMKALNDWGQTCEGVRPGGERG